MIRRHLFKFAGSIALFLPFRGLAQQAKARRLAVIMAAGQTPEYVAALAAFRDTLQELGWKDGNNLRIDERWAAGVPEKARSAVSEIAALKPDLILGQSAAVVEVLASMSRAVPVVFVHVADPVAAGFISSLAHPGGNVTGVTNTEPSIGGKWLQLLKEAAPGTRRVAMLVNPDTQPDRGAIFLKSFEAAAREMGVERIKGEVHDLEDIDAIGGELAKAPGGAMAVVPDAFLATHSARIVAVAERLRLPAIYPYRYYVAQGGLLSYGVDNIDLFRQAAAYVDRILRGTRPADLPVQQPTRFKLVINSKTAKALDLSLPPVLLARADEVIE